MTRHQVEVSQLEFDEGGNTIWIHGPQGATVMRIKCSGRIEVMADCVNICAHADVMVDGDILVCIPVTPARSSANSKEPEAREAGPV